MRNRSEGEEIQVDGQDCIRTAGGGQTHAIFGPYVSLDGGRYLAEFWIAKAPGLAVPDDYLCAILDVAAGGGQHILAHGFIFAAQLTEELQRFQVAFELNGPADRIEYRVRARGAAPLIVADNAAAFRADGAATMPASLAPDCALVRDTPGEIVTLFQRGYTILRADKGFRFDVGGLVVHAEERDDVNFVGEVFEQKAYHLLSGADQCFIDVGMNVGLTTLLFASRANVREVHSFEPFATTYRKAMTNLALNPGIAGKITAHNVGLSDHGGEERILVPDTSDSGSRSTISVDTGRPITLTLRDAAACFAPIIEAARANNRQVVAKIDCEGSEFAIFDTLSRAGLLGQVDAYLVEWHAMFAGKTAQTLTGPLLDAGFTVIDLSPPSGNGFFYAIRTQQPRSADRWWSLRRLLGRSRRH